MTMNETQAERDNRIQLADHGSIADALTPAQYSRLLDIAMPLTAEEKNVDVDTLYAELSGVTA